MNKENVLLFLLVILWTQQLKADEFIFNNISSHEGLFETSVYCIAQDYEGYVWTGTQDGLFKYDGNKLEVFKKERKKYQSLWDSNISNIFEDSQKNLWVSTAQGLNRYNRDLNLFEKIVIRDSSNRLFEGIIYDMVEDGQNNIWAATNQGVIQIEINTLKISRPFNGFYGNGELVLISDITIDNNGILWVSYKDPQKGGLLSFNPKTKERSRITSKSSLAPIDANDITCVTVDKNNNLWIGYFNKGIEVLNQNTGELRTYRHDPKNNRSLTNNLIHNITLDKDGKVYIGTDNGLNIYEPETDDFVRIKSNSSLTSLLSDIIIGSPLCASDNSMWFPCKGGGVSVYDPKFVKFKTYGQGKGGVNVGDLSHVIAFAEDGMKNIWISTDGNGIYRYNKITQEFKNFSFDSNSKNSLTNNKVLSLLADDKQGLWVGMWQGGLCYYHIIGDSLVLKKRISNLTEIKDNPSSIYKIVQSQNNDLWFGTYEEGLFKYEIGNDAFKQYELDSSLNFNSVYAIQEDYLGNVWIAVIDNGVFCMDVSNEQLRHYSFEPDVMGSLAAATVYVIIEDSNNRLWFGTRGGGLCTFNRASEQFITFTSSDGLPSDKIVGLQEDNAGNLWISSNRGISMMTLNDDSDSLRAIFKNYTKADGLQSNSFNPWSYFKDSEGRLYFGGNMGFNSFLPEEVISNVIAPQVYLVDFLLFNKAVDIGTKMSPLRKHISQTRELVLNHNQSIFTFKFNVINFIQNDKCQFAYKLDGFENEWNYVGNQRLATYTNIPAGDYVFRVKASNNDGFWNELGLSMRLKILPAWWQTWFFKLGLFVFIVLLLIILYKYRVRALKHQKERLEKSVAIRTVELNTMNVTLRGQQDEIQTQNIDLRSREEEMKHLNEELYSSNEHLNFQKSELESVVSRLEETQLQLIEAEKMAMVGTLTSGIAHEINNPLNFIQGGKTALELYVYDNIPVHNKEIKPYIEMIDEGIERATTILKGLNRFNRKSGDYNERCEIHLTIDNCLIMLQNQTKYHIEINKSYKAIKNNVLGNEGELHQVFINILNNAIHALNKKGSIEISTTNKNDSIIISIKDTGSGIEEKYLNKITEPFFTTKSPGEGTGLGLSIVYSIIKKHKGIIQFESEKNIGTQVNITLPYIADSL